MKKTNSSFNLSKTTKKLANDIQDKHTRRVFLNLMIEAEANQASGKNRKFSDPAVAQKGIKNNQQEQQS